MNDFILYHNLCNLCAQIGPYAADQELFLELKRATEQYSSKSYRVAVIGEFKRGKSSLVNALVGAEILPTDILPTTGVINRIIYAVDQKIIIYFKNGEVRESAIDSLADYATKLDEEKERFAATIREIVVQYPFVLGQNHIELIDTPGLNDNESMTETTLNVLGEIDTAIVVISATMPLSMTEQNLICDLIKQTDIYNLVFAVTFIDRVSDEEEDQDRVVELIKNRLSEDTLQNFCDRFEDPYLIEKAKRILSQPNVYAVSSKQAIQGFFKGRNDLLEKSRFKQFKYNLSALLTANQEKDQLLKIKRICLELEKQVPLWIEQHFRQMEENLQAMQNQCEVLQSLQTSSLAYLNALLLRMEEDAYTKKDAVFADLTNGVETEKYFARFFISQLSSIKRSTFSKEVVLAALQRACRSANLCMEAVAVEMTAIIDELTKAVFAELDSRYEAEFSRLNVYPQATLGPVDRKICAAKLSAEQIFGGMSGLEDECMPYVSKSIQAGLAAFDSDMENYMAANRVLLIRYHKSIKAILENALSDVAAEIANKQKQLQHDRNTVGNKQSQIEDTISKIKEITN